MTPASLKSLVYFGLALTAIIVFIAIYSGHTVASLDASLEALASHDERHHRKPSLYRLQYRPMLIALGLLTGVISLYSLFRFTRRS